MSKTSLCYLAVFAGVFCAAIYFIPSQSYKIEGQHNKSKYLSHCASPLASPDASGRGTGCGSKY